METCKLLNIFGSLTKIYRLFVSKERKIFWTFFDKTFEVFIKNFEINIKAVLAVCFCMCVELEFVLKVLFMSIFFIASVVAAIVRCQRGQQTKARKAHWTKWWWWWWWWSHNTIQNDYDDKNSLTKWFYCEWCDVWKKNSQWTHPNIQTYTVMQMAKNRYIQHELQS